MVSIQNISIQFGSRVLFHDVSFLIGPHDRIGLVGSNGSGKSTLLKAIMGLLATDDGKIEKARYVTIGYLPQDGIVSSGKTLYHEVESSFENILAVQRGLEDTQQQLSHLDPQSDEYLEILEITGELHHKLEDLDAFRMKSRIEQILMGLGFSKEDFDRPTEEFSGGWQMRIELAKLLLKEPSVLLLDEPTNHLDIESLQWLENYLLQYDGAVILVSHDRAFLDTIGKRTLALGGGRVEEYSGNYSFYERERVVRKQLLLNAKKNQQQQMKQTEQFIERFRYKATKARQVQSRIKQLERIDLIEVEQDEEEIHFIFPPPPSSGRIVMELKDVRKSYDSNLVFDHLNLAIEKGDRIGILGVNGAGKSTLSRIIAGTEPLSAGQRVIGEKTRLSYFAQHQAEELDLTKEVLETVNEIAAGEIRTKLRSILGAFLFHGDDVFKKVSVLSGGEKSRLALAKMLLQPSNFLIMDEPTNHLDMKSKKVLQEALSAFEGSFIIVSHDRAFVDPLITKVIEVRHGGIRTFLGNITDYLMRKKGEGEAQSTIHQTIGKNISESRQTELSEKERRRSEAEHRQKLYQKLQPLRKRLREIEALIENLEKQKAELEQLMTTADLYKEGARVKAAALQYEEVKTTLEQSYQNWEQLEKEIAIVTRS